jgi:hypothetical protein
MLLLFENKEEDHGERKKKKEEEQVKKSKWTKPSIALAWSMRRQSLPTAQMGALPSALVRVSALTWQHVTVANYQDRSHQCSLSSRHYRYI